jgi:hypothetical protein
MVVPFPLLGAVRPTTVSATIEVTAMVARALASFFDVDFDDGFLTRRSED